MQDEVTDTQGKERNSKSAMILEYDRSPGANADQKIQSLMESVQRAFNNIDAGTLTGNMSTLVRINGGSLFGIIDGDYVFVKNLDADSIKAVNEWVDKLLVQTNLLANDGQIFTLDAIEVNAANITAGTLDVERIILTIDGEKYMFDPRGHYEKTKDTTIVSGKTYYVRTGTDPNYVYVEVDNPVQADIGNYYEFLTYEKLDGDIIEDLTITADKIVSGSIMTRHITTQDIEGTSGWINLRNGTFFYGNGVNFATADNAIYWDGSKLKIKADDFYLSSGKSIFDEIDEIETWFYATDPTLANEPAVNWTTFEAKQMHLRDIYYNTDSGHSFRWAIVEVDNPTGNPSTSGYLELVNGEYVPSTDTSVDPLKTYYTFGWMEIVDADLEAALERLSDAETAISQNADSIVSLASANATYVTPTGNTATNALTTKITQTATSIESLAANNATYTKPDGTTGTNQMQSAITQNATNIGLKVSKDSVISEINLSSEAATISADKINIAGTITAINNDTTTTIDGDKITTGSLSASAVDATSGYFDTANIPNLNASKITSGTIDASVISVTNIDASEINTGTLDASDITVTNLDGDCITAGSIAASAIDATSGTFATANIPDLNASKITAGNISADRMSANAISAINADLTTATINTAHIPNLSADKITSGSISADRMSANAISAINADLSSATINSAHIPNLSATKITSGDISADRMKTNAISAINADLTSATINTAHIPNLSADKITSGDIDTARLKANVITAVNNNTTTSIDGGKIDVLTDDGTSGIYLHPSSQSPSSGSEGNSVKIDNNGMKVYKGSTLVASYGDTAQVGKSSSGHTTIQGSGMQVYGNDGTLELANLGYGSGKNESGGTSSAPYYTLGYRKPNTTVGNYSVAEGWNTTASGAYSHGEGVNNTASGTGAHSEGSHTTASNYYAHSENYGTTASAENSHAEGYNTTASGNQAHAEGYATIAKGTNSHTQNVYTVATEQAQTVIGKYNAATRSGSGTSANPYTYTNVGNYAFIIGNGSGDDTASRSNALTVDWDGNIRANTETPTLSFTTTTGTLKSYSCRRFGNVVQLRLTFNNSSAVASGANIYEGTLNTTALRPQAVATGASYYGAHAIGGMLNTAGSITVRNASSSSVTISGDNTATISFTYIL